MTVPDQDPITSSNDMALTHFVPDAGIIEGHVNHHKIVDGECLKQVSANSISGNVLLLDLLLRLTVTS